MEKKTLENTSTDVVIGAPVIIVVLVLLLGGTVFLWRARYMRRRTAYVTMAVLSIALLAVCYSMIASQ